MGIDADLGMALVKAYQAAGMKLPKSGRVLITVKHADKRSIVAEARTLIALGYELLATQGTWQALRANGLACQRINKVHEGRPHIVDAIKNRELDLIFNTPVGKLQRYDDSYIRSSAVNAGIPCITTLAGIRAVVSALNALHAGAPEVRSLQEYHAQYER
jgi:carbamoyl-phosphate synthase large subunit